MYGEVGPCRVSQAAGFAHLLEDDGVHASAEILVVEGDLRVGCKVEFLAAVRILHVVELLGVVLGKHDLVFIGGLQRAELFFQRLEVRRRFVVHGQRLRHLLLRLRAVV